MRYKLSSLNTPINTTIKATIKALALALALSLLAPLFASALSQKIINLIGTESYEKNRNYIEKIFSNEQRFYIQYDNGTQVLNLPRVIKTLRENGLLGLKFSRPSELVLTFRARIQPLFLIKNLNSILSDVGFVYYTIKRADFDGKMSSVAYSVQTEHALDPMVLLSELKKRGYALLDVSKSAKTAWSYSLAHVYSALKDAHMVVYSDDTEIKEVSGQYLLKVDLKRRASDGKIGGNTLYILPSESIRWYPKLVIFNDNLQIIGIINEKTLFSNIKLPLPPGAKFVLITDGVNPLRLKNGIRVNLSL